MLSMAIKKSARWKKWQDTGWKSPAVKEKSCGVKTQLSPELFHQEQRDVASCGTVIK